MWRQRLRKFKDNPMVVYSFLKNRLYYPLIADKKSNEYKSHNFIDSVETIKTITGKDTSLIRVGDGTYGYLLGSSIYFNNWHFRYDKAFSKKLDNAMLAGQDLNILFCFPHDFILKTKEEFKAEGILNEWPIWTSAKVLSKRYLKTDHTYGNSMCFHPRYNPQIDFGALKDYLSKKHILIITSNTERFTDIKIGLSTHFIEAPSSDAWTVYESLEEKTLQYLCEKNLAKSEVVIMVSAAEAAKVIVFDLAKLGYTAWDTGQFFDLASKEFSALSN